MTENTTRHRQSKEQKTITNIYAVMTVALIMSFVPLAAAALFSMIMFTGGLIAAYTIRKKAEAGDLAANHMTYMIRTIWISSFYALLTTSLAAVYVLYYYDPTPVHVCAQDMMNGTLANMSACIDRFIAVNGRVFTIGGLMAAGPVVLYFIYRLIKGISRASKGHRIGNVKGWF